MGNTIVTLWQSIPAAGTDPVTLLEKLPRKVTNPGDLSLLVLTSQILYIFFNHPYVISVKYAGVKCNEENLFWYKTLISLYIGQIMCWKVTMIQIAHYKNFVRDTYSHQHNEFSVCLVFKSKVLFYSMYWITGTPRFKLLLLSLFLNHLDTGTRMDLHLWKLIKTLVQHNSTSVHSCPRY